MSTSNSQTFEYEGETYSTTVVNGQISVISQQDSNGLYTPVDPSTDLFTDLSLEDASINHIRINKGEKPYTETELAALDKEDWVIENDVFQDEELLTRNYNESLKNYNNALRIENPDNEDPFTTGLEHANPVISVETLRYPYDIDIQQDHLKITQYKYERTSDAAADQIGIKQGVFGTDINPANGLKYTMSVQRSGPDNFVAGEYQGGVILPMPKVSDSNGAEWGKSDLNVFELGAVNLGATVMDTLSDPFANFKGLFGSKPEGYEDLSEAEQANVLRRNMQTKFEDSGFGNPGAMGIAGMGIAAQELGKLAGLDISADEFLARSTGRILNPNAELLFQGPVLRDFGFKFLLIARSEAEAKMIRSIIRFFKIGSAPIFNGGPSLLGTPNIFKLEYKAGSKKLDTVNKFNEMALRTITVDYAPDGFWSAYQDSHPVAVVLNLQFSELKPIYQRNHTQESVNSVGY